MLVIITKAILQENNVVSLHSPAMSLLQINFDLLHTVPVDTVWKQYQFDCHARDIIIIMQVLCILLQTVLLLMTCEKNQTTIKNQSVGRRSM